MARWGEKVLLGDVFHAEALSFVERRDAIVARLTATRWFKRAGLDDDLVSLVEELSETSDEDEFDEVWTCVYDVADADRVWIDVWAASS